MVSVKTKIIAGRKYKYAEYSFRLPDGSVKKLSKLVKSESEAKSTETASYFKEKETEAYQNYALSLYKTDVVFSKDTIMQIEAMRVEYRHILRKLTKAQLKDVIGRFTINFTYESNAIEGNSLTLKDVTFVIRENILPKGKDLREVYETRNTREANELLFRHGIKITIKDILSLHRTLVKETGVASGFKQVPNFLWMRNLETAPPEKVEEEMNALVNWYSESKGRLHPLKTAAEFHSRFERIHPFEDGNGRTGRILINAILLENRYPPLIIRKTTRRAYFSALEAYDGGYKLKFERFLLEKFKDTFNKFFKMYVRYLK